MKPTAEELDLRICAGLAVVLFVPIVVLFFPVWMPLYFIGKWWIERHEKREWPLPPGPIPPIRPPPFAKKG